MIIQKNNKLLVIEIVKINSNRALKFYFNFEFCIKLNQKKTYLIFIFIRSEFLIKKIKAKVANTI